MPIAFSLFDILLIIGISQGLVTSVLLLVSNGNQQSKKILGFTVLVFSIVNCKVLLHTSGLWNIPFFRYCPVGMELLLPPLIYLYILSLTEADFKLNKQKLWHLLPGSLYAIYDILVYLLTVVENDMLAKRLVSESLYFDQSNIIEDYLIVVLSITYIVLGYKVVITYFSWLTQFNNHKQLPIYRWLKNILVWGALLGFVLTVNQFLATFSLAMEESSNRWRFFNLLVAFVTYYIGFMGYKNDNLKIHDSKESLRSLSSQLNSNHYQKTASLLRKKLEDEAVYLDNELTLKDLAETLEVTPESLSRVINHSFEVSFRELINQYRVNHVKKLLKETNDEHSILDLALASGFNSQASFYRAFKKSEGVSPKVYLVNSAN